MDGAAIPSEKLYFKIGEVAKIVGVKPYVLRYWETEFSVIRPGKTRSQHRLYRRKDVETLLSIKDLLHERRFTIEGARRHLRGATDGADNPGETKVRRDLKALREIRDQLIDLRETLS